MKLDLKRNGLSPCAELITIKSYKDNLEFWCFDLVYKLKYTDGSCKKLVLYGVGNPFPEGYCLEPGNDDEKKYCYINLFPHLPNVNSEPFDSYSIIDLPNDPGAFTPND